MSFPQRFLRILLLNQGLIFILFLIILSALYFSDEQKNFFNSWSFAIAIVLYIYLQFYAWILTILFSLNVSQKWILFINLFLAILLTINQLGFYYFNLPDLLARLIDTGIYMMIIITFQVSFQLLSAFICRRRKWINT